MRDRYVGDAFNQICKDAETTADWYVCLMASESRYGGPEEGGWWTNDTHVEAYKKFPSEELAEAAKEAIDKLAKELSEAARTEYGRQCLREMEWLEERWLDADYLPEPDGPEQYYVIVSRGIPESEYGPTHYE